MPTSFASIEPGSGNKNACTPALEKDFIGVRIAAPEVVRFVPGAREPITNTFARLMVCGTYRLDSYVAYQIGGGFLEAANLIATDADQHHVYVGKMQHGHPMQPDPDPPQWTAADFKNQTEQGYFNENLLDFLALPERAGRYQVFVTIGPYKSNVVTVSLEPEGKEKEVTRPPGPP